MLNNLEILNGDISLQFDPLNTIYTITVNNEDDYLKFNYEIGKNDTLNVYGNNLVNGVNEVVLTVYNKSQQTSYYLYVLKKDTSLVTNLDDNKTNLEITKESVNTYTAPLIGVSCFLLILLFFTLLFKKN